MTEYIGGVRYQPAVAPNLGRPDDWTDRIGCKNADPRLFDAPEGREDQITTLRRLARARAICTHCPVTAECVAKGKQDGASGIRGGIHFKNGQPSALDKQDGAA